jgi:hypothetical protein
MAELVDTGEEWYHKTDITGVASLNHGLYDDSTDSISDTNNLSDISTEPSGASYSRQDASISVRDISGDAGFDNDNQESFDLSDDSSGSVDSWFNLDNFQSDVMNAQGSAQDNLIATGDLSQSYSLGDVDTLDIDAQSMGVTVN